MLIEVTCIKWNLIGTDTGSLTDRHDADGLRGEKGGVRETGKGRENGREVWERKQSRGKRNIVSLLLYTATLKDSYDSRQ